MTRTLLVRFGITLVCAMATLTASQAGLAPDPGVSGGWMAEVSRDLQAREYHFRAADGGVVSAPNPAQGFRIVAAANCVEVRGARDLRFSVGLTAWGRGAEVSAVAPGRRRHESNRLEYDRPGLVEWYVNGPHGLEHGFTLDGPPGPDGSAEPVVLALRFGTDLEARVTDAGATVMFGRGGLDVLRYGDLAVFDATGRALSARFATRGGTLSIVIDDRDALYPVEVDPLLTDPAWTDQGDQARAEFGFAAHGGGDVNGDGYDDVVVGAINYDLDQDDEGAAFLYLGSASGLGTDPAWQGEGNVTASRYGVSASTSGDFNGDGYHDLVVGADWDVTSAGRVYVYLGSASGPSGSADWTGEGTGLALGFGWRVDSAGDVNGDGIDDLIVGAYGGAFVYHGSSSGLPADPSWSAAGGGSFGVGASGAGDVNGDGYDDVIIGDYHYSNGQTDEGAAFVYLGSAIGLETNWAWRTEPDVAGALLGYGVCGAGDVNGDGYDDVIVSAFHYTSGGLVERGAAFVHYGSATGPSPSPDWSYLGASAGDTLGVSVHCAGDVNGDGYGDILVGAPNDEAATGGGIAYSFHGSASGLSATPDWEKESANEGGRFGWRVGEAGDVNGDGYDDAVIGARFYTDGEDNEGAAFVYHGFCDGGDLDGDLQCAGNPTFDCDDGNADVWAIPGEVSGLVFPDRDTITWSAPVEIGATSCVYDTLRSQDPSDFTAGTCVEIDDGSDTAATDTATPSAGAAFYYLVRAQNACPSGDGSLGHDSSGGERAGRSCP